MEPKPLYDPSITDSELDALSPDEYRKVQEMTARRFQRKAWVKINTMMDAIDVKKIGSSQSHQLMSAAINGFETLTDVKRGQLSPVLLNVLLDSDMETKEEETPNEIGSDSGGSVPYSGLQDLEDGPSSPDLRERQGSSADSPGSPLS